MGQDAPDGKLFKDEKMGTLQRNPALRQGQFIWMDEGARSSYLEALKKKIADGFYYSEKVISSIVEEIAPVLTDSFDAEGY